jgi:hypothetical protein
MLTILFLWLPLCIAVGMFASIRRNRSGFGWFLFSFLLSPLLGIIFVAILREREPRGPSEGMTYAERSFSQTFWVVVVLGVAALLIAFKPAHSESFYDRNGHFAGSSTPTGPNTISFYDNNGHFAGTAVRNSDGTTSFYDRNGHFAGSGSRIMSPPAPNGANK